MFEMDAPWWEYVARAMIIYIALMFMVRISGKRTIGQFTPFDLLVVMLLSESVSNSLSANDRSVLAGLVLSATLIALNVAFAALSARSTRLEHWMEGAPVLVGRHGEIFHEVLKRERLGLGELEKALRASDCTLAEMEYAFLETDGSVSIMKRGKSSPPQS